MIITFHAAVADATVAFSPVLGSAELGSAVLGTAPVGNAAAAAAGSVAQTWIRSAAFGPLHTCAVSASGAEYAHVAVAPGATVAPGAKAVAPAARRHRTPGASVVDRRHRLHCR
ncbi:hypothetical protein [Rhodococcus sp. AW25M09]|uniref:hypothetical protein n=1 Tax=Rhodococcus sp. AW25M09 TaxID=1268303 RepID=UPI0005B50417|nr:hypothetical protein [Rhodococcus sp. AW25M09]